MSLNEDLEVDQAKVIFEPVVIEESSEDPPIMDWTSLDFEIDEKNNKRARYQQGLYDPGSGEVCTKYVTMSDSQVFINPFYKYPPVQDPGIKEALLDPPEPIIYPDDGQILYLKICKEMNQCPVKRFHRGLLEHVIDLRYYCVNPVGIRAMALALQFNRNVKVLNLTDNFLNIDASYHLGDMLTRNSCLYELNLSGCRVGASGAKCLFVGLRSNRTLKVLNLNRNQLGDEGVEHLANAVINGIDIQKVYLRSNQIGNNGAAALAKAFETHNKFVVLDLSYNNLFSPVGVCNLLSRLQENRNLQELYLSWNSLSGSRLGQALSDAMKAPNLCHLDVSNNKLAGGAITTLIRRLPEAKKLITLDLSYNPMSAEDALAVLTKLAVVTVKVQRVLMENIFVNNTFLTLLESIKERRNLVVTYGGVKSVFKPVDADLREIALNRADYLTKKQKKRTSNLALVVLRLAKDNNLIMNTKDFYMAIKAASLPLDDDLINEITNMFPGPRTEKSNTIDVSLLVDYIKRKWPDENLPPTPPQEPEPASVVPRKKVKGSKRKN